MYKISFYVPSSHVDQVKIAMFEKGAGKIGNYSYCSWQILGEGQFMPIAGSHAFIGEQNQLETVSEFKVEMVCDHAHIKEVIAALRQSHPYEEPAYQVLRLEEF
ncbi:MAG TPA: NGG1p interacting factor NIF3 [Gammaproteobacteria bacterium]|jgi:structural hemagglutinin/hemolysin toxin protein RtxA|nr:NGG1p interacting factor NIF3 [Gammaproteobacteria bacterium]